MPAVAGIKKQGANNGAALSFLIATPETGVDSIALTYALLGPFLAIVRPVAAFVTAFSAGLTENFLSGAADKGRPTHASSAEIERVELLGFGARLSAGMRFAFGDLMADLVVWFMLGVILAGAITALVPDSLVKTYTGSGIVSYLVMLAISLPMYVCATMSTPIAAALLMKGLSPGAALVFMLAGPATNMATLTVVGGMMGRRTLAVYLGSVVVCALACAFAVDFAYETLGVSALAVGSLEASEIMPKWLEISAALLLAVLMTRTIAQTGPITLARRAFSKPERPEESSTAGLDAAKNTCCSEDLGSGGT